MAATFNHIIYGLFNYGNQVTGGYYTGEDGNVVLVCPGDPAGQSLHVSPTLFYHVAAYDVGNLQTQILFIFTAEEIIYDSCKIIPIAQDAAFTLQMGPEAAYNLFMNDNASIPVSVESQGEGEVGVDDSEDASVDEPPMASIDLSFASQADFPITLPEEADVPVSVPTQADVVLGLLSEAEAHVTAEENEDVDIVSPICERCEQ